MPTTIRTVVITLGAVVTIAVFAGLALMIINRAPKNRGSASPDRLVQSYLSALQDNNYD